MKNYVKEKKTKSTYGKWVNPMLLLYGLSIVLCGVPVFVITFAAPKEILETALYISIAVVGVAFFGISVILLCWGVPHLKKVQARKDFARHDFSPYTSTADTEEFYCEYHLCRYTMVASPFDEDGNLTFNTDDEVRDYISQHFAQTLLSMQDFYNGSDKSQFFINYYDDSKNGVTIRVDKKTDGEKTTLDLTEQHRVCFNEDGLKVGEKLYSYGDLEASVITGFGKMTDFYVNVRLFIFLADEGYLSFETSSRLAETVKRFNIKITNPETFKYVLADPLHAFEQTALQLGLRKLK